MARQMRENFRVKGKKLYFGLVDLEKAFDKVPREVISWAMRKLGVQEWLVSAVMSMYIDITADSMFEQFDPSMRSTLHRVAFAFVDWQ